MATRRDPLARVVDAAVALPVCAATAAARTVPVALHAGARQLARIAELAARVAQEARDGPEHAEPQATATVTADTIIAEASEPDPALDGNDRDARPTASDPDEVDVDELPIDGYDQLAARQIVDRLSSLTVDELALVASYERAHRHRRTVLGKLEQLGAAT
jgi:hypothetical protein